MSDPDEFQSLYYTDCRPGQGLRGGAGFQFQSVSSGVGHDVMTLVQRSGLYEAPTSWMREHRPVADYPASLAHDYDGVYMTARGIYLGAEVNGVREGNQFTHAVATADPGHYGLLRPAQLWGARWWSEKPADTTECDAVLAHPERGPWGIDVTREWVLGQPASQEWLTAVHSALDRVHELGRRRVVFVAADPAAILAWITAGTLLLPQARALRVGFRVFTANPQRSQHDVLGVHPDWARSLANPTRDGEFIVFNLDTGKHSEVEPTESAEFWVPRFLGEDPFDVVDAIELAHRFATEGPAGDDADPRESAVDRQAAAVVSLDESCADPARAAELAGWLAEQRESPGEDIVVPLAEAILSARPELAALRRLEDAARRHGVRGPLASRIRGGLLDAELDAVVEGNWQDTAASAPRQAPHRWTDASREAALDRVEQVATTLPAERMDDLLRVAARFGLAPGMDRLRDAAERFVQWWAAHPEARLDPSAWPDGALLVDQLRDVLVRQRDDGRQRAAVRQYWWRLLMPVDHVETPLDASVAAAAVEQGGPRVERQVRAAVFEMVERRRAADTGDLAWDALFRYREPTPEQILELLEKLWPGALSAECAGRMGAELERSVERRLTGVELRALARLEELGWAAPTPGLSMLARQNKTLDRWLFAVDGGSRNMLDAAAHLDGVTEPVFRARRSEVTHVMLDVLSGRDAARVLDRATAGDRSDLPLFLAKELSRLWEEPTRQTSRAAAIGYLAICTLPDHAIGQFEDRLRQWAKKAPREDIAEADQVLRSVNPQIAKDWSFFASAARQRGRGTPKIPAGQKRSEPGRTAPPVQVAPPGGDSTEQSKSRWGLRWPRKREGD